MNDASFNLAMQALGIARSFLALHDWAEFDARCGRADAAGAILDPTLYREAMDILPLLREAGQAAALGCADIHQYRRNRPLDRDQVDWVIAGGESGAGARVCRLEWLRGLRGQCAAAGVPLFVKQLGSLVWDGERQAAARLVQLESRKGGVMEEWPEDLRVREWPKRRAEDA